MITLGISYSVSYQLECLGSLATSNFQLQLDGIGLCFEGYPLFYGA